MSSPLGDEDDVFESLSKKVDPKVLDEREKAVNDRIAAQYAAAQQRLENLIGENLTLPVTINSIRVIGANRTRKGFLDKIFLPLLSANQDRPYTLQEALQVLGSSGDKLRKFGIFHDNVSMFIDRPDQTDPSTTTNDIDVWMSVKERGPWTVKTGTNLGNTEGEAYGNFYLRNIFGGAESLSVNASAGTRTRSAYSAVFATPILSDPDHVLSISGLATSIQKPWASHEEVAKGGSVKYSWSSSSRSLHEIGFSAAWRQITALANNASPSVRADAGDSVKSSISHTYTSERRDNPFLPTRGYMLKTMSELAGVGPLAGDVAFFKTEVETAAAIPIAIPGFRSARTSGISLTGSLRAGLLYPLPLGLGGYSQQSRTNDRFVLGGPTDIRGFKIGGLGPHDGADAVGGDVFAAGSLNLLFPFPRVGADSPLRFQIFANSGRLLALKGTDRTDESRGMDGKSVRNSVFKTMTELGNELPSTAVGLGVVYAHPVARFELNFGLPVIARRGEEARKGLQFGVGISFM